MGPMVGRWHNVTEGSAYTSTTMETSLLRSNPEPLPGYAVLPLFARLKLRKQRKTISHPVTAA